MSAAMTTPVVPATIALAPIAAPPAATAALPAPAISTAVAAATSAATNVAAAAPVAATATPAAALATALTPAAAARAKKLASGGMNFVERPNAVYISARNLAPPPPAQVPVLASSSAPAALVVAAEAGPVVPAFSVVRWLCTSRSAWSWLVRLLGVASVAALAFAAVKVYQAWLADMKRRQAWREESRQLALKSSVQQPGIAGSTSAEAATGAANFQSLSALICARYALLQRYSAMLKHVQFATTAPGSSSASGSSEDKPTEPPAADLTDAAKLKMVFDELEGVLHENAYLKDLLRRVNSQLQK